MAYLALYRKYRPQTFDEVVGQKAIVQTLKNALKDNKIAHAYLFCGPRGTGKTSMARLFAKALNCQQGLGEQCNKCEDCLEITQGRHPDVYEIDAASNSGVDNIRRLIEEVSYAPILGRYKVYIIDEVHSMSTSAFNALLKTLEEPPKNVIFILATTEPNKVLPTIMSRVQRFDFSKVSFSELVGLMERILDKENVSYEKEALEVIARISDGGVRDALSNLEQAISYSKDNISLNDVYDLFGLFRIDDELNLVKMIHLNDVKGVLEFIKQRYQKGGDIVKLHLDLINIYKDLLVFGTTRDPSLLTYLKPDEAINIIVTPSEIRNNLDVLIKANRDYKMAINSYDNFEMTILNLTIANKQFVSNNSNTTINLQPNNNIQPIKDDKQEIKNTTIGEVKPKEAQISSQKDAENSEILDENTGVKLEDKIEVKPEVQQVNHTMISSSMIGETHSISQEPYLDINSDFILNIMLQGSKVMKQNIQSNWKEKLSSLAVSDPLNSLAKQLERTEVCLAANKVVVVKSFFEVINRSINSKQGQEQSIQLLKKLFDFDGRIIAISSTSYIDNVNRYKNLVQANNLPEVKPIEFNFIYPSNKKEETNAEKFFNSIRKE